MPASLPDFNTLKYMAEQDPQGLEQLRQEKILALIESSPEAYRHRLRGLQFQIDVQRRLAKNPMQACLNISRMMHDSLHLLQEKLNEASAQHDPANKKQQKSSACSITTARIITFPSPRS